MFEDWTQFANYGGIVMGLLALLTATMLWIAANKYERERDEANERAKALARSIGCGVLITVKQSSDDRWRLGVARLDPSQDTDTDWISTGDGYETATDAKALAYRYWPDAAIVVEHGEKESRDG